MPIVFEEVTGEIAPRGASEETATPAPAPEAQGDPRETLLLELALIRERQARLFAD